MPDKEELRKYLNDPKRAVILARKGIDPKKLKKLAQRYEPVGLPGTETEPYQKPGTKSTPETPKQKDARLKKAHQETGKGRHPKYGWAKSAKGHVESPLFSLEDLIPNPATLLKSAAKLGIIPFGWKMIKGIVRDKAGKEVSADLLQQVANKHGEKALRKIGNISDELVEETMKKVPKPPPKSKLVQVREAKAKSGRQEKADEFYGTKAHSPYHDELATELKKLSSRDAIGEAGTKQAGRWYERTIPNTTRKAISHLEKDQTERLLGNIKKMDRLIGAILTRTGGLTKMQNIQFERLINGLARAGLIDPDLYSRQGYGIRYVDNQMELLKGVLKAHLKHGHRGG